MASLRAILIARAAPRGARALGPGAFKMAALCAGIATLDMTAAGGLLSAPPWALQVGAFSSATAGGAYPNSWKPLTFEKIDRHTAYTLAEDDGVVALRAESRDSSSGLTREIEIDAAKYPIIEWRWKVENVLENGDVSKKSGDDYPARIYITFAYDPSKAGFILKAKYKLARLLYGQYPPLGAINYIWANQAPVGAMVANPYTNRVKMIVIESGPDKTGQWVDESRNLFDDYQAAFGAPPPMISGVAVMTDTDNTHESAVAWFGDIVFKAAE